METAYDSVIDFISKHYPGDEAAKQQQFVQPLKRDYRPGSPRHSELTEQQWRSYIDAMQTDNLTKTSAWNQVVKLKELETRHDEKAVELATKSDSLENLRKADQAEYESESLKYGRQYADLIRDESEKLLSSPEMEPYRKIRPIFYS